MLFRSEVVGSAILLLDHVLEHIFQDAHHTGAINVLEVFKLRERFYQFGVFITGYCLFHDFGLILSKENITRVSLI